MFYSPVEKVPLILYYLAISRNEVEKQSVMHFVVTIFANEPSVAELDKQSVSVLDLRFVKFYFWWFLFSYCLWQLLLLFDDTLKESAVISMFSNEPTGF